MAVWNVKVKYGKPGQPKSSTQSVRVEAESESMAATLAQSKFKNSNAAYRDAEVDVVEVKRQ